MKINDAVRPEAGRLFLQRRDRALLIGAGGQEKCRVPRSDPDAFEHRVATERDLADLVDARAGAALCAGA